MRESELVIWYDAIAVRESNDVMINNHFQYFTYCWCKADRSVTGRIVRWLIFFKDGKNFGAFPASRKIFII